MTSFKINYNEPSRDKSKLAEKGSNQLFADCKIMGLALVEMVMRIETEFEITIPAELAEKMTTPRSVIDYLMSRKKVGEKWSREYVSIMVWQIIEDEGGISVKGFDDDSRFIEDMGMD